VPHRNARLTVYARMLLVERHRAGWSQARIAEQLGVSRGTVKKWIDRYDTEGPGGLEDRCSRPHTTPRRTSDGIEAQVLALREASRRGAVFRPVSPGWSHRRADPGPPPGARAGGRRRDHRPTGPAAPRRAALRTSPAR